MYTQALNSCLLAPERLLDILAHFIVFEALRHFRSQKGLSQEQLGLEGGFDRTYISLMERGLRSPTLRAVVKLAEVLQVSPSEIIKRMEREMAKDRG